jgi:hypothetical protein
VWTHREVAPGADVALRLRYAELRLQKGFDELLSLGAINDVDQTGERRDKCQQAHLHRLAPSELQVSQPSDSR